MIKRRQFILLACIAVVSFIVLTHNYIFNAAIKSDENTAMRGLPIFIDEGQRRLSAVNEMNSVEYNKQRDMLLFSAGNICARTERLCFSESEKNKYANGIIFVEAVRDVAFFLPTDISKLNGEKKDRTFSTFNDYISLLSEALKQASSFKSLLSFLESDARTAIWIQSFFDTTAS